ncbi:MAG TPA: hypothetical protein VI757_12095 [Bacteroidia bacterium]|nr:hypothetical protein [Bacteroidia bacterium]
MKTNSKSSSETSLSAPVTLITEAPQYTGMRISYQMPFYFLIISTLRKYGNEMSYNELCSEKMLSHWMMLKAMREPQLLFALSDLRGEGIIDLILNEQQTAIVGIKL